MKKEQQEKHQKEAAVTPGAGTSEQTPDNGANTGQATPAKQ
jgi:hypothetical protein